ncbi:hypothetical protein HER32_01410 [Hymenobacter sp. BT18]|uniref:STAS/SEC14 domain-containing protein n=1 Tax=Hymenobacter sp. BT18 TaxID=2835648 RepID=UPI00143E3EA4|nr:STAS/SEC14 domain-containing protein [Hymenobacter sp. BT18]QIX59919.1 hypothetical protein HER32_01410 [Hymenobacter sp. BT18]
MMPALPYVASAFVSLTYQAGQHVALQWKLSDGSEAELKALYTHVLQVMIAHRAPRLLSDHRLRPPMSMSLQHWLQTEWIPQAIREARYSHCAIVESSNPIGRLAARAIGMAVNPTLAVQYFQTSEEAAAWLRQASPAR